MPLSTSTEKVAPTISASGESKDLSDPPSGSGSVPKVNIVQGNGQSIVETAKSHAQSLVVDGSDNDNNIDIPPELFEEKNNLFNKIYRWLEKNTGDDFEKVNIFFIYP